jgi:hypothetical protein
MAKRIPSIGRNSGDIKPLTKKPVSTPVRNTAVPKPPASKPREVTHEQISRRAYEIHLSGEGGSEMDNWLRAERELRGA